MPATVVIMMCVSWSSYHCMFFLSGIFVRKMLLLFNKMSFGQVLHLMTLIKRYLDDANGCSDCEVEKRYTKMIVVLFFSFYNFLTG